MDWKNQLDALCVITTQCSSAAVRCFLCEVYSCSGVVKTRPSGEPAPPSCECPAALVALQAFRAWQVSVALATCVKLLKQQ